MTKKTYYKDKKVIYFSNKNKRTDFFKAKVQNKRIINKVRISKKKLEADIKRLKNINKK